MRKVGTRRIWNFVNSLYGEKIFSGKKHFVFEAIDSIIVDFNAYAFHTQDDLAKVLMEKLKDYIDLPEVNLTKAMDMIADYMFKKLIENKKK